eukprot:1178252-Prymnesium_polylepis.2
MWGGSRVVQLAGHLPLLYAHTPRVVRGRCTNQQPLLHSCDHFDQVDAALAQRSLCLVRVQTRRVDAVGVLSVHSMHEGMDASHAERSLLVKWTLCAHSVHFSLGL